MVERRLRLGMLDLEPRHDQRSGPVRAQNERDGALRRHEGEPGVVEDVVRVEEHDSREACPLSLGEQRIAAGTVLLGRDGDRREHGRTD